MRRLRAGARGGAARLVASGCDQSVAYVSGAGTVTTTVTGEVRQSRMATQRRCNARLPRGDDGDDARIEAIREGPVQHYEAACVDDTLFSQRIEHACGSRDLGARR